MAFNFMAFQPPHARARALDGPIRVLAENLLAINDYVDRTATTTPGQKNDKTISLTPVNTMVHYTNIVSLNTAIQTHFQSDASLVPAPIGNKESGEEDEKPSETQASADTPIPRSGKNASIENLLLTVSNLDYIGMNTDYMKPTGRSANVNHYTITWCPV